MNGKTLRTGTRRVHGLEFQEWLLERQSSYGALHMLYDYTLEINSESGNSRKPLLVVDLSSGVKHPCGAPTTEEAAVAVPLAKASLNAQETMGLWDKVSPTLRPRPGAF